MEGTEEWLKTETGEKTTFERWAEIGETCHFVVFWLKKYQV